MKSDITKKAIAEALRELLKEKSLNRVSVKDIASKCQINRHTFYYHFLDIPDLVEWTCLEQFKNIADNRSLYWQDDVYELLKLMKQDHDFIINIYHSASLESLKRYLYRMADPYIREHVSSKAKGLNIKNEDIEFVISFYKYSLVSFLLEWVGNDMKDDPKALIDHLYILIDGTVSRALEIYQTK